MQEKITFSQRSLVKFKLAAFFSLILSSCFLVTNAQTACPNSVLLFNENFGTGTTITSHPDVFNLIFSPSGGLNDGYYRVANNTLQRGDWHNAPDHTSNDVDGKMLLVNGVPGAFYQKEIASTPAGFLPGMYNASLFLINCDVIGACSFNPVLPVVTLTVEYNTSPTSTTGWMPLQTITANGVAQYATPTWVPLSGSFTLSVPARRFRYTLSDNNALADCGNDYALDDISLSACPVGGPLPVSFVGIAATQKGAAVSISWSTSSEQNNKSFDVERSNDGGATWHFVGSVAGSGNSNSIKNYAANDAKPAVGVNLYRVKQVDTDGNFRFSNIAKVEIVINKTEISVLSNPFVTNITVDFLTGKSQLLTVKLVDLAGKLVATERWNIAKGSSRKYFENVNGLNRGMYIISILDENGNILYNNKLMKQ
ncbi:MAG: hypothetical protein JWQ27_563 [Ferruginibacter sp.]|nr:hypothetical protein [Ferruginibacter sp.]